MINVTIAAIARTWRLSALSVRNWYEGEEVECAGRVARSAVSRPSTAVRSLVSIRPEVPGLLDRRLLVSWAPAGLRSVRRHLRQYLVATLCAAASSMAAPPVKLPWYRSTVPQLGVPMMSQAPTIDGVVGEAEWQSAAAFTGLMSTRDPYVLPRVMQPSVFVAYDATNLYLALRSPIPPPFKYAPKGLRSKGDEHDDARTIESGDHWSIRFLIGPSKAEVTYLFYLNPKGVFSDQRITKRGKGKNRHQVGLDWTSGARVKGLAGKEHWDLEIAIPLNGLGFGATPAPGTAWRTIISRGRGYGSMDNSFCEWNGAVPHFMHDQAYHRFQQILAAFDLFDEGQTAFLPYWRNRDTVEFSDPNTRVSLFHHRKRRRTLIVLVNPAKASVRGILRLSADHLGGSQGRLMDAETDEDIAFTCDGRRIRATVEVPSREYRLLTWQAGD